MGRRASAIVVCAALLLAVGLQCAGAEFVPRTVLAPSLATLRQARLGELRALTDVNGQMYGCGAGYLAQLDENGAFTRTVNTGIARVAGMAPYVGGKLLVGDGASNALMAVDPNTGQAARIMGLAEAQFGGDVARFKSIVDTGKLTSVAFDGRFVYAALEAGFSSSIFKIDPQNRSVVAHGWSPGPDTNAMAAGADGLFVLNSEGKEVRRYNEALVQNYQAMQVQTEKPNGLVIRGGEFRVLSPAAGSIIKITPDMQLLKTAPPQIALPGAITGIRPDIRKIDPNLKVIERKNYALLVCGDVAESGFWYDCFWNDTMWLYKVLIEKYGYQPQDIFVLYGWGNDYYSSNPNYRYPTRVTDFPATKLWLYKVLDGMKNGDASIGVAKLNESDSLFAFLFDHGGGVSPAYLCLVGDDISDAEFSLKFNAIPAAQKLAFMQQCRSGGFIPELTNSGTSTFAASACREGYNAYVSGDDYERVNSRDYHHGEFNFHLISALDGRTMAGAPANADANGNGKLSALEVFNYIVSRDNATEQPQKGDPRGIGTNCYWKE